MPWSVVVIHAYRVLDQDTAIGVGSGLLVGDPEDEVRVVELQALDPCGFGGIKNRVDLRGCHVPEG